MSDQLTKMRQGRERQLAQQRENYAIAQAAYLEWVREEANAFRQRLAAEEEHSRNSDEFREADSDWHTWLGLMPTPPPDHAWS